MAGSEDRSVPMTNPKKAHGESFEEAANAPNNPKKDHQPDQTQVGSYNVNHYYCNDEDSDD